MDTAREDRTTEGAPTPPQAWPEEPAGPHEGTASAAPDELEHQTIEEPGYGHGV